MTMNTMTIGAFRGIPGIPRGHTTDFLRGIPCPTPLCLSRRAALLVVLGHDGDLVVVDLDDEVFHGKIEGIDDLVSYEGTTVAELKKNFRKAVDDYIALCSEAGKKPAKSCKGTFNVRIPVDLHQAAVRKAKLLGVSLNQIVKSALEREVFSASKGVHA